MKNELGDQLQAVSWGFFRNWEGHKEETGEFEPFQTPVNSITDLFWFKVLDYRKNYQNWRSEIQCTPQLLHFDF